MDYRINLPISTHCDNHAIFYSTNRTITTTSGHVLAIISKNVTASQAEAILSMLTRDVNGVRVGNGVSVTSSQLVMMHLPLDVLNYVPLTGLQSSPTGNRPVGWQEAVFNSVVDAAEFLANGIIALGIFMTRRYIIRITITTNTMAGE